MHVAHASLLAGRRRALFAGAAAPMEPCCVVVGTHALVVFVPDSASWTVAVRLDWEQLQCSAAASCEHTLQLTSPLLADDEPVRVACATADDHRRLDEAIVRTRTRWQRHRASATGGGHHASMYDRVGVLLKMSGFVRKQLNCRLFCLDGARLHYARTLQLSKLDRTIELDGSHVRASPREQQDGSTEYFLELTEQRRGEPHSVLMQASSVEELRDWAQALSLAARLNQDVPYVAVLQRNAGTVVADVLLGSWRRRAAAVALLMDLFVAAGAAAGEQAARWNVEVDELCLHYACNRDLLFVTICPARLGDGDVARMLQDVVPAVHQALLQNVEGVCEPSEQWDFVPLSNDLLRRDAAVCSGRTAVCDAIYQVLAAASPNCRNSSVTLASSRPTPRATDADEQEHVVLETNTGRADLLALPAWAAPRAAGDVFCLHRVRELELDADGPASSPGARSAPQTIRAPASSGALLATSMGSLVASSGSARPGWDDRLPPVDVATELVRSFYRSRANFYRSLVFVDVRHDAGEVVVPGERQGERLDAVVEHVRGDGRRSHLLSARELDAAVASALHAALA